MKSISIDFKNKMISIMTEAQHGTEHADPDTEKIKFHSFIPEEYREFDSFTWNFENESFSVNRDYDLQPGCIMGADAFAPQLIIPMPGLKDRFKEFTAILGYEETESLGILADWMLAILRG